MKGRFRFLRQDAAALAVFALLSGEAAAQTIRSFQIQPPAPTTGDRVTLRAVVAFPEDCGWQASGGIGFGTQEEMGEIPGWGLDLLVSRASGSCKPVPVQIPVELDLGNLPVAAGPGILRLLVDSLYIEKRAFQMTVAAGPAPGWAQPAAHGGFERLTRTMGVTFDPEGQLISDVLNHAMIVIDPRDGAGLRAFESPASGDVRGLAFDGTFLYASVLDRFGPNIYRLDLQGGILDGFPSPVVSGNVRPLESLAVRGGVLYGTYDTPPLLFAIDPVSHRKLWERALPSRIYGLDTIPEGLLGSDAEGAIYLIEASPTGTDLLLGDSVDVGIPGFPDISALAYDGQGIVAWDRSLSIARSLRTLALWWALDGSLRSYVPEGGRDVDVIRGDVGNIGFEGSFIGLGPTECLVADGPGGVVDNEDRPPEGRAFFYLARFRTVSALDTSYGRSFPHSLRRVDEYDACP